MMEGILRHYVLFSASHILIGPCVWLAFSILALVVPPYLHLISYHPLPIPLQISTADMELRDSLTDTYQHDTHFFSGCRAYYPELDKTGTYRPVGFHIIKIISCQGAPCPVQ